MNTRTVQHILDRALERRGTQIMSHSIALNTVRHEVSRLGGLFEDAVRDRGPLDAGQLDAWLDGRSLDDHTKQAMGDVLRFTLARSQQDTVETGEVNDAL